MRTLLRVLMVAMLGILAIGFISPTAMAQEEEWVVHYDGPNLTDMAWALAVDAEGNVLVTGASTGNPYTNPPGWGSDYATVKYDTDGNQLWVSRYNNGTDYALALAVDAEGNVFVTGESDGNGTFTDYTTVKYDPDGNELWVSRYDGSGHSHDYAKALAVDAGGNVFVTGWSVDSDLIANDYATVKYDPDGNQLWARRYDEPAGQSGSGDGAYALAVDAGGNVFVTGFSHGGVTGYDYATIKYDPDGNQLWVSRYHRLHDQALALAVDAGGNVLVTGVSYASAPDTYDWVTIKYDTNGDELWVSRYDGLGSYDKPTALAVDAEGNVFVTGISFNEAGVYTDYATVKYNGQNGEAMWVRRYDGTGNRHDEPAALAIDAGGNVFVTGESDGGNTGTGYDYATVKYDPDGNQLWVSRYNNPGSHDNHATALGVDTEGNVFVTGRSPAPYGWDDYVTVKYSSATTDSDGDGIPDDQDICPFDFDNDADGDGVCGDVDACPFDFDNDADGDGVCGDVDVCPGGDDNLDTDGDDLADFCDVCPLDSTNDGDDDGLCFNEDNCPFDPNSDQSDVDEDGQGDACDDDIDGDGVDNSDDNCPFDPNSDQSDVDEDGQGDACDDNDGDGVVDAVDACVPTPVGEVVDARGCSIGELCPCENNWKNHGAYVRCVAHTSEDFVEAGLISEAEKDAIVSAAGESDCGHRNR